jgi:UDP-glucose 4-epimerase
VFVVTGASGFIGRAVALALAHRGAPVLAASRRSIDMNAPIQTRQLRSYAELAPTSADCILLHLAEPRDIDSAAIVGEVYVADQRAALAELLAKGWGHVVYASSAAVYGDKDRAPHRADQAIKPRGAYAQAKAVCEQDVLAYNGTVARLANVYGPGMAANNVISDILRQIPGDGPLQVRDRKPTRDYLWIDDLADGLASLAMSRRPNIFNFGTGRGISVGELARIALDKSDEPSRPVAALGDERESHLVVDISETTAQLGWKPGVTIEQGLATLLGVT